VRLTTTWPGAVLPPPAPAFARSRETIQWNRESDTHLARDVGDRPLPKNAPRAASPTPAGRTCASTASSTDEVTGIGVDVSKEGASMPPTTRLRTVARERRRGGSVAARALTPPHSRLRA
jgi:hypothetical protein